MQLSVEDQAHDQVAKAEQLPDHDLVDVVQAVDDAEQEDVNPEDQEDGEKNPVDELARASIVLGQEHDLHVRPKEGHYERAMARSREIEQAVPV